MLLEQPLFYYEKIKEKFKNSYLAEDKTQIIIGIDCDYIDEKDIDFYGLRSYFDTNRNRSLAPFAGLFGVFAYSGVRYFEYIGEEKAKKYEFPKFIYADAKAYMHFDKMSKIYTFYGDKERYYDFLLNLKAGESGKRECEFSVKTDLSEEKKHFENMVEVAKEYIRSGDVFQVVLGELLEISTNMNSLDFYKKLATANPSPYMFHFPTPYGDVVGSSPELVFEMKNEQIFARTLGKIDVLQVGHHGSKTSTSEYLLSQVRPDVAIISRGRWNPWKFPHYSVMERLHRYKSAVENTLIFDRTCGAFGCHLLTGTSSVSRY